MERRGNGDTFAEIYAEFYRPLESEKIEGLVRILCNRTDETNISVCLERAKTKGWDLNCNEVYPNLFISDAEAAKNIEYLKEIGVTHVLNTAEGDRFGMVNTNADYYKGSGIKYLGLPLKDLPTESISKYFHQAADFIDEGLASGGKVVVHCVMGISRSSSCTIAYLMIKKRMTVQEAIQQVKNHREIRPNNGFLMQLAELDKMLKLKSKS
ncbi:dual specificity protein phosphatase 3 [Planococcus citri]|uniref:dual specificity protein phosphatase 3 n=1 Tax=Planococcus citri TaxID=170843 RepID=UPI0031F9B0B2